MSSTKNTYWDRDVAELVCIRRLQSLVTFLEIENRYTPLSPLLTAGLSDAKASLNELSAAREKVSAQMKLDIDSAKKWLSAHSTTELAVIEGGSHDPRSA